MAIILRDYQQDFKRDILEAWERFRSVLAVCPTGGGKTATFSDIMHDWQGAKAAIVHRKEILGQISLSLAKLEVKHRIIAPPAVVKRIRRRHLKAVGRSFIDPGAEAGVVSVQTLTSRSAGNNAELQSWVNQCGLAVFDEGHHYVKQGLWGRAVDMFDEAFRLFVTASPERADGKGLGVMADGFAEIMVEGPTTQWLIEQGYLAPFKYFSPSTDLDVSQLSTGSTGDFNSKALRKRVVESHIVGDVVSHYMQFARDKRAIVFATDVETAEEIAAAFRAADVACAALSGETDATVRDNTLDDFEANRLQVLVNVDLFDEGFDVPGVDAVILARPTESLAKYLQMVGRALRVIYANGFDLKTAGGRRAAIAASEKPHAIIIDPVRNWERHGMPNWPRKWSLDGKQSNSRSSGPSDTVPQRVCDVCTQPFERFYVACPHCGHEPEPAGRSAPEQVDGDLTELDVEAMAAIFEKIKRADMGDEEYALDQARRHIPSIGRRQDMLRHQRARERRDVLRNLVGWWIGMQPADRPLGEKHRRFYHRFGVDIGTAFTLKEKDTDALIQLIEQRFGEDLGG